MAHPPPPIQPNSESNSHHQTEPSPPAEGAATKWSTAQDADAGNTPDTDTGNASNQEATMPEFIPSPPTMGRSIIDHDPRNRAWPARALFAAELPRCNLTWRRGEAYDKCPTCSCDGQSFKGVLNSQTVSG
jgi:hypothetical protein